MTEPRIAVVYADYGQFYLQDLDAYGRWLKGGAAMGPGQGWACRSPASSAATATTASRSSHAARPTSTASSSDSPPTVLPAMLKAGSGTLLFTTGGGAINPYPALVGVNTAQAGLRNWVRNLHNTLGEQGVYAPEQTCDVRVGSGWPVGSPWDRPCEHRQPPA